jgi:hypothetical protein
MTERAAARLRPCISHNQAVERFHKTRSHECFDTS